MTEQTRSPFKVLRLMVGIGLMVSGITGLTPLTKFEMNSALAHPADVKCRPIKGRNTTFFFENCWWQKWRCVHTQHPAASRFFTKKISCPDLNSLNQTIRPPDRKDIYKGILKKIGPEKTRQDWVLYKCGGVGCQ